MIDLYVMRHAKAKTAAKGMDDRHRSLSGRGQRQVAAMARPLQRLGAFDGEIHASPAMRTRQTLLGLDAQLAGADLAGRAHYPEALYTFDSKPLREWLGATLATTDRLLLIGHNPALLALARWLCPQAPAALPTGGLLHLALPDSAARALRKHRAELVTQLVPAQADHALFKRQAPKAPDLEKAGLARRILGLLHHQYRMARALEPGVIAGFDPEFLHQYRVNLRRSRAIGESVLATTEIPGLKKALKRLKRRAQATSDLRDLDVFLESLERAPTVLSTGTRTALRDWLARRARERHAALCQALSRPDYAQDMTQWQRLLSTKPFRRALRALSADQVQAVLAERISRHDADLAALHAEAPDEAFHELRKTVKRIRYLAELEPVRNRDFLAGLKQRQTVLGDFQDLCTRQAWLTAFADTRSPPAAETIPMEAHHWSETLEQRKAELRRAIVAFDPLAGSGPSA
ncbi:CHAD domain-containing protein [Billgrantia azerbaijanica]|nr:CHAD domain-containing protein [Halomonas azerbaijanica]